MPANMIEDAIAHLTKSHTVMGLTLIGASAALLLFNQRFLYNAFAGPFPMDEQTLVAMKNPSTASKYYVLVVPEKVMLTDIGWIRHRKNETEGKATAGLLLLQVGQHLVPTRMELDKRDLDQLKMQAIIGEIRPPEKELTALLQKEFKDPRMLEAILPMEFKASTSFKGVAYLVCLIAGIFAALGAWRAARAQLVWADIEKHPIGKALAVRGRLSEVKQEVNADFTADGVKMPSSGSLVGNKWVLALGQKPTLVSMKDLVWIHPKVLNVMTGAVDTAKPGAVFYLASGDRLECRMALEDVLQMSSLINTRAPWVFTGYDAGRNKQWKTQPSELTAEVEQRRKAAGK